MFVPVSFSSVLALLIIAFSRLFLDLHSHTASGPETPQCSLASPRQTKNSSDKFLCFTDVFSGRDHGTRHHHWCHRSLLVFSSQVNVHVMSEEVRQNSHHETAGADDEDRG